ncbi:MAG: hypothetical protein Udaeo_04640 [Candidatus Udaeobacter sp.]|nr:MAG: hypothetical protein Udaeo_04640 [Candidatus Udaeobacter sp.]
MACLSSKRRVQRDEIGTGKQIVEFIHQFYLQTAGARGGQVRIVSNDSHTKTNCTSAQFAADAAHADNAQRFVVQFDAFEILLVPVFAANVCVSLRNFSRDAEQQRKGMFGSRDGIPARSVQHNDAPACRCLDINVIYSNTGAAHDTQFVAGIQNFGGDFGLAAHHQRAERRNQLDEFALVQAGFKRDLQRVLAREFVHSALRNGIGDEDLRRSHGSFAV